MLCFFTLSLNLALFRLIVAINKRAVNVFVFSSTATTESLHYLCIWNVSTLVWCTGDFETEQVLLQYRGEVWFLLVLWTSCNVLLTTSLRDHSGEIYLCMNVSGDVCDEVVSHSSMSKPAAFLAELTSVQTSSWCQRPLCSFWHAVCPSCIPLREMLDIDDLDPARQPQRKSKSDYVELVSRSREAKCVCGWS